MTVVDGASFDPNGGLVDFSGLYCGLPDYSIDFDTPTQTFDDVTVSQHGGYCGAGDRSVIAIPAGKRVVVKGTFRHVGSKLGGEWELHGDFFVGAAASRGAYNNEISWGTLLLVGTGDQFYDSVPGGRSARVVIDKPSGVVAPALGATDLAIAGLLLQRGSFVAPRNLLSLQSPASGSIFACVPDPPTFDPNGGTLELRGVSRCDDPRHTIDFTASELTVETVRVVSTTSTFCGSSQRSTMVVSAGTRLIVAGDFTHTGARGHLRGEWELRGDIDFAGVTTSNGGTATLLLAGGVEQLWSASNSTLPTGLVNIDKPSGAVRLASDLSIGAIGQNLRVTAGELDLAGFTLTVGDTIVIENDGLFRVSGGAHVPPFGGPQFIVLEGGQYIP